jgi:hypothetical protein
MFSTLETAIRAHLANAIAGVAVMGTYDQVDLAATDAPRLAMQVEYQGFDALENRPAAVTLGHRFAVHVLVDAGRARDTERDAAEAGLQTVIQRMLAWPDSKLRAEIQPSPVTQSDGRALRLSVFFTLAPVVLTAA